MSGIKNAGRKQPGLVTGLVIVVVGFVVGFKGVDLAISVANGSAESATAKNALDRQLSELDTMVTASLGPNVAVRKVGNGLPEKLGKSSTVMVNRAAKSDWIRDPRTKLKKENTLQVTESKVAALEPSVNVLSDTGLSVKTEVKAETLSFAPKRALDEDYPQADNADVALFAADMPLPAKLKVQREVATDAPLADDSDKSGFPHSPLIPRTFNTGKAFGGLSEIEFQKRERRCMTTALYFEARSEPDSGQIAVGQVIMNRVRSPEYPDTICGVVYQGSQRRTGCQFSFTCDGKADRPKNAQQWERSKRLADKVLEGRIWLKEIGHSTHYHATYVAPGWRREMNKIKRIGHHIFYKSPEVSVTDTYQRVPGRNS